MTEHRTARFDHAPRCPPARSTPGSPDPESVSSADRAEGAPRNGTSQAQATTDRSGYRADHRTAPGTGHRAPGTGHRAPGTGHRAPGTGHRAPGRNCGRVHAATNRQPGVARGGSCPTGAGRLGLPDGSRSAGAAWLERVGNPRSASAHDAPGSSQPGQQPWSVRRHTTCPGCRPSSDKRGGEGTRRTRITPSTANPGSDRTRPTPATPSTANPGGEGARRARITASWDGNPGAVAPGR